MSMTTRNFTTLANSINSVINAETELSNRILFAAEVIRNTVRKLTVSYDPQFSWTRGYASPSQFTNFKFNVADKKTEGAFDLREMYEDKDLIYETKISFQGILRNGQVTEPISLPIGLLMNDPIAVAQYVRKTSQSTAEKEYHTQLADARKNVQNTADKLKRTQDELLKVQQEAEKALQDLEKKTLVKSPTDKAARRARRQKKVQEV
jgi:hypothetical protein